jgi:phosphoribosylaminoimidazolecarboxamide formyltransferase/IMP cyclohydrolase
VATGATLAQAYDRALACDPTSAFGGIVALNSRLDAATAAKVLEIFTEVVIAPDADEDAVALFRKKKNVRLLVTGGLPDPTTPARTFRSVTGGFLTQSRDTARLTPADLKVVTKRAPTDAEVRDMLFAFTVAKHVKSNAIVYAKAGQTLGIGAGQMNRKDSARIAALRAADFDLDLAGSACASEAFFPFPDGLIQAADAGCTAVIQPGGSIGDEKVIEAADERGLAMVFTGVRVFRH